MYYDIYDCGFSKIIMISDMYNLIGLYFQEQRNFNEIYRQYKKKDLSIFIATKQWLDLYFNGKIPNFIPPIKLDSTPFRIRVWQILQTIGIGEITTYKNISKIIASENDINKMSSQAVGNAVSMNPISIIIPCHRVIGSNKTLVGYSGGLKLKSKLLQLEGIKL